MPCPISPAPSTPTFWICCAIGPPLVISRCREPSTIAAVSIVESEDRGAVRHIVLNRPEKRNAMNQELLHALAAELREAAADPSVHCVVLRGNGPVFSAGVDLNELMSSTGQAGMLRPF